MQFINYILFNSKLILRPSYLAIILLISPPFLRYIYLFYNFICNSESYGIIISIRKLFPPMSEKILEQHDLSNCPYIQPIMCLYSDLPPFTQLTFNSCIGKGNCHNITKYQSKIRIVWACSIFIILMLSHSYV